VAERSESWEVEMNVERGCLSKQAYLTKADAKQVSKLMSARNREAFHLYACPNCRYWHVAHVVPAAIRAALVPNFSRPAVRFG
jgi:hypothetical protein